MLSKQSRQVRGETGALFEIDASMIDEPRSLDGPFRAPAGPLPAHAIKPARPRRRWTWLLVLAGMIAALATGALAGSLVSRGADAPRSPDLLGVD